jgi:hypothetical protein
MIKLKKTTNLDKVLLVERIREQFTKIEQLKYRRTLLEFFDDQGKFLGDNVFETTFKLRNGDAPLVYEVSGPYDVVSKEYATNARVYYRAELQFECDMKSGIFQRTAAMVWLYLDTLKRIPKKTLLIGAGKVALQTSAYLKHFSPALESIDYQDLTRKTDFEHQLQELGLTAQYLSDPDFSMYDTIIIATNTNTCIIHERNFSTLKPGTVIVSLCTTSQSGEISEEIYARTNLNIFLDYNLSKTFTEDMRKANNLGYLDKAILFHDILAGQSDFDLATKVNIIRLTGTPLQNVAVIDMMLEVENIAL